MSEIEFLRQEIAALREEVRQLRAAIPPIYSPPTHPIPVSPFWYQPTWDKGSGDILPVMPTITCDAYSRHGR